MIDFGDWLLPEGLILEFVGREIAVWLFDILESIAEKMPPYLQIDPQSATCTFRLGVLIVLLSCSWHGQTSCVASDVTDILCKIIMTWLMTWVDVAYGWWRELTSCVAADILCTCWRGLTSCVADGEGWRFVLVMTLTDFLCSTSCVIDDVDWRPVCGTSCVTEDVDWRPLWPMTWTDVLHGWWRWLPSCLVRLAWPKTWTDVLCGRWVNVLRRWGGMHWLQLGCLNDSGIDVSLVGYNTCMYIARCGQITRIVISSVTCTT